MHKVTISPVFFSVTWKGYEGPEAQTWEPKENLLSCEDLLNVSRCVFTSCAPTAGKFVLFIKVVGISLYIQFVKYLLLLFTRPLLRDRGMAGDHGAPEAGELPRVWTRGRRETESRQRVSGAKRP